MKGQLRHQVFKSRALGIRKPYYVYQSEHWRPDRPFLMLWLFRGHEREWVNISEDKTRVHSTAIQDLDTLIRRDQLPPAIAIMPGLNSSNNWISSGGLNMQGSWPKEMRGLGSGKFWNYLTDELMPYIDQSLDPHHMAKRAAFGFSMGGFTVQLLSTRKPGYLHHAAIYDGIFPWAKHIDPRIKGKDQSDKIWTSSPVFDAALGRPRNPKALLEWNPTDQLLQADDQHLNQMKKTNFWINSASADGSFGNIDRTKYLVKALRERGMPNHHPSIPFAEDAKHDWHWNDTFFYTTLLKMANDF
jgi:hypothetical protein